MPHPEIFAVLEPGAELLLDDGRVRLKVLQAGADFADMEVMAGDKLSDRKGVNVPDKILGISAITDKDREDLVFALGLGIDWVAMSFAQQPDDVARVKELIAGAAPLMVKIEKPSAVANLDAMIEQADAIMVARGDLGVEMPPEMVPGVQKEIIRACRLAGKPVVVATQMLESMIMAPVPTRAEASDVATAVFDGADAVMLSGESAMGAYPVEAVAMMHRIITQTEQGRFYRPGLEALQIHLEATGSDAISAAASQTAETVEAKAIITHTRTGRTAYRAARERPTVPILCLTPTLEAARQLAIVWGVHCVHTAHIVDLRALVEKTLDVTVKEGFAEKGDRVVITAGVPFGHVGKTNLLRIADVV
jgi:pyruvate kinase